METEPEPVVQSEVEPEPESVDKIPETETEPVPAVEAVHEVEVEPEPETVPETKPEVKPEPGTAEIEITVEDLLSAYETDVKAADDQFANKTLKITGSIGRIEVKEALDIYYVTLVSTEKERLQTVRCVFSQANGEELNDLESGQKVTIQGIYDGSVIDIRMRDCILL